MGDPHADTCTKLDDTPICDDDDPYRRTKALTSRVAPGYEAETDIPDGR